MPAVTPNEDYRVNEAANLQLGHPALCIIPIQVLSMLADDNMTT